MRFGDKKILQQTHYFSACMGVLLRYARVVLTMIVHTVLPFVTSVQFIELAHFLLLGSGPVVTERTVVSLRMNVNHDSQCANTCMLLCFLILSHRHIIW